MCHVQEKLEAERSPIAMIRKKDGSYCFAVDNRKLIVVTKGMYFLPPRFEDVIDLVGHAQAQSPLHLQSI